MDFDDANEVEIVNKFDHKEVLGKIIRYRIDGYHVIGTVGDYCYETKTYYVGHNSIDLRCTPFEVLRPVTKYVPITPAVTQMNKGEFYKILTALDCDDETMRANQITFCVDNSVAVGPREILIENAKLDDVHAFFARFRNHLEKIQQVTIYGLMMAHFDVTIPNHIKIHFISCPKLETTNRGGDGEIEHEHCRKFGC